MGKKNKDQDVYEGLNMDAILASAHNSMRGGKYESTSEEPVGVPIKRSKPEEKQAAPAFTYKDFIRDKKEKKKKKKDKFSGDYDLSINTEDMPMSEEALINMAFQDNEDEDMETHIPTVPVSKYGSWGNPDETPEMTDDLKSRIMAAATQSAAPKPIETPIHNAKYEEEVREEEKISITDVPSFTLTSAKPEAPVVSAIKTDANKEPVTGPMATVLFKDLSARCSIRYNRIPEFQRLYITDGIMHIDVDASAMITLQDYAPEALINMARHGEDAIDPVFVVSILTLYKKFITVMMFPSAIFTRDEFSEAFGRIDSIDTRNFKFYEDERNGYVYAYHVNALMQRELNAFVNETVAAIADRHEFLEEYLDEIPDTETLMNLCELYVYLTIARQFTHPHREFNPDNSILMKGFLDTEYTDEDGVSRKKYNLKDDFVQLCKVHNKTVEGTTVHDIDEDMVDILDTDDYWYVASTAWDQIWFYNNALHDMDPVIDHDEDEDYEEDEDDVFQEANIDVDADAEEMMKQIESYQSDGISYATAERLMRSSNAAVEQFYNAYAEEFVKQNPGKMPMPFEDFLENYESAIASSTAVWSALSTPASVETEQVPIKQVPVAESAVVSKTETVSETVAVGSGVMADAMAKAGLTPVTHHTDEPKRNVLPVVRRTKR